MVTRLENKLTSNLSRKIMNQPDQKVHWKIPRKTTKRCILLTVSSDAIIDLRNVRGYVRHSSIIKPIDPYSRVPFNCISFQVMECSSHMLKKKKGTSEKTVSTSTPTFPPQITKMEYGNT